MPVAAGFNSLTRGVPRAGDEEALTGVAVPGAPGSADVDAAGTGDPAGLEWPPLQADSNPMSVVLMKSLRVAVRRAVPALPGRPVQPAGGPSATDAVPDSPRPARTG